MPGGSSGCQGSSSRQWCSTLPWPSCSFPWSRGVRLSIGTSHLRQWKIRRSLVSKPLLARAATGSMVVQVGPRSSLSFRWSTHGKTRFGRSCTSPHCFFVSLEFLFCPMPSWLALRRSQIRPHRRRSKTRPFTFSTHTRHSYALRVASAVVFAHERLDCVRCWSSMLTVLPNLTRRVRRSTSIPMFPFILMLLRKRLSMSVEDGFACRALHSCIALIHTF
jgi:hypothetical protein